jgi:hypothetical protein
MTDERKERVNPQVECTFCGCMTEYAPIDMWQSEIDHE